MRSAQITSAIAPGVYSHRHVSTIHARTTVRTYKYVLCTHDDDYVRAPIAVNTRVAQAVTPILKSLLDFPSISPAVGL